MLGLFQWQILNRYGTFLLLVAQRDFLGRSDGEFYSNGISNSVWRYPISMKGKYTFEPHVVLCEFYSMSTEQFARFMKCLEYETQ